MFCAVMRASAKIMQVEATCEWYRDILKKRAHKIGFIAKKDSMGLMHAFIVSFFSFGRSIICPEVLPRFDTKLSFL